MADIPEDRLRLYRNYVTTHLTHPVGRTGSHTPPVIEFVPSNRLLSILEVGCGSGELLQVLHDRGYRSLAGVDVSQEQVEVAHSRGRDFVRLGNVFDLPVDTASVDVVIAVDVLEHMLHTEVLDLLDWAKTILKPEGTIILQVPNATSPFFGNYAYGDFTHRTVFNERSLRQILGIAGFSGVTMHAVGPAGHGTRATLRRLLWGAMASAMKLVLATETGRIGGHIVTQNIIACATVPDGARDLGR